MDKVAAIHIDSDDGVWVRKAAVTYISEKNSDDITSCNKRLKIPD